MEYILCLEFPIGLDTEQKHLIDRWLEVSRLIYNRGLAELEDWDRNTGYYVPKGVSDRLNEKGEPKPYYAPVCQLPWKMYRDADGNNIPYSEILSDWSRWYVKEAKRVRVPTPAEAKDSWGWQMEGASGYSCPIPVDYKEPLLKNWQLQAAGGLGQVAKADYWRNPEVLGMPYKLRVGVLSMLETPWQEYLKSRIGKSEGPRRGKPKPKRKRDLVEAVIHPNPKNAIVPDGKDWLRGVPKIGRVEVPGLKRRWRNPDGSIPEIVTFKIVKRNGDYRVQLTGRLVRSYPVKQNNKSTGIDPGLTQEFSLSTGEQIAPKKFYRRQQRQREKLQRQIAHKLTQNLILWLNHPDRSVNDVQSLINVSQPDAAALMQCKTEKAVIDLVGSSRMNRLKFGIPQSNRIKVLQLRAKLLERMVAGQRKAEDDKLTSKIVREYSAIAIEDGLQSANLKKRPDAKKDDQGKYTKNNAKAKSGLAKSLSDASPGRKIAMLQQKSKRSGREFGKVAAPYTSIACPVCAPAKDFKKWLEAGNYSSNLDGDRMYRCKCGWHIDRDLNSGTNIELTSFGWDLSKQVSANADRARKACCKFAVTQPKGWKPRWADKLTNSKWLEVRDAVLAGAESERVTIDRRSRQRSRLVSRDRGSKTIANAVQGVLQLR